MGLLKNNYITKYLDASLSQKSGRTFKGTISTDDIVGCPLHTYFLLKNADTRVKPHAECVYKNILLFYGSSDIKVLAYNKDIVDPVSNIQSVADLIIEFNDSLYVVKFVEVENEEDLDHPLNTDVVSCALSVDICSVHSGLLVLCHGNSRKIHYVDPDDEDLELLLEKAQQRCKSIFESVGDAKPPAPRKSSECNVCSFKSFCPAFL